MGTTTGIRQIITKDANQALDTSTVLVAVTNFSIALAAGKSCKVRGWVPFALAGTASGAKFQLVPPTTPTFYLLSWKLFSGASTGTLAAFADQTTSAAFSNALASAANHLLEFDAFVTANTAGSVILQFAQLVSDAGAITILKGGTIDVTLL
jgi:hypothetical protein